MPRWLPFSISYQKHIQLTLQSTVLLLPFSLSSPSQSSHIHPIPSCIRSHNPSCTKKGPEMDRSSIKVTQHQSQHQGWSPYTLKALIPTCPVPTPTVIVSLTQPMPDQSKQNQESGCMNFLPGPLPTAGISPPCHAQVLLPLLLGHAGRLLGKWNISANATYSQVSSSPLPNGPQGLREAQPSPW